MTRPVLRLALVAHLLLALGYLVCVPVFESPDEDAHFDYVSHLATAGTLPRIMGLVAPGEPENRDEQVLGHHPPLYFSLLAATLKLAGHGDTLSSARPNPRFGDIREKVEGRKRRTKGSASRHLRFRHGEDEIWPVSDEVIVFWLLRGWSVLMGLVTVWLVFRLAALAFPGRPAVADGAALTVACLPMWSFMSGVIDNGNLAVMLSHATLLVLARAVVHERFGVGTGLVLGVLTGLALVTKLTALFLVPLLGLVYGWALVTGRMPRGRVIASGLTTLGTLSALSGWFFLRNAELYDGPLATGAHANAFAVNMIPEGRVQEWLLTGFLPSILKSFLGYFGWWSLGPRPWVVNLGLVLGVAALVGCCLPRRPDTPPARRGVLVILALAGAAVFAATLRFNLVFMQGQARYLFPALAAFAIPVAAGLVSLGSRLPAGPRRVAGWLGLMGPPLLGVIVLVNQVRPKFDPALAAAPPWHLSLVAAAHHEPGEPALRIVKPDDDLATRAAPIMVWEDPETIEGDKRYTLRVWDATGRVLMASYERYGRALRGHRWMMPAEGWAMLPAETEMLWRIQRLPDQSDGDTPDDRWASPVQRLTKAAPSD